MKAVVTFFSGVVSLVLASVAMPASGEGEAPAAGGDLYDRYVEAQSRFTAAFQRDGERWAEYEEPPPILDEEEEPAPGSYEAFLRQDQSARAEFYAAQEAAWRGFVERERQAWERYVAEVEAKWQAFLGSTHREWVAYSSDRESRSYVDFENGYGVFEALVPADAPNPEQLAAEKLTAMMNAALLINSKVTGPVLQGQIADKQGVEGSLASPARSERVVGQDGVARDKFHVQFALVEDHLLRRAERYWPLVETYSEEYELDTPLVMAIIETESAFNPRARSWANAYGLMQIVPKFAGRESWREIYEEDGIPDSQYLLDPENNVRHGSCYLNILENRYWRKVPQGPRRDYLVICSYNCGASTVRRLVRKEVGDPARADEGELYKLLASRTPDETRDYLTKVMARREKWTVH